jgi:uncharacterized protein YjbI with pentapeptide repeats
MRSNTLILDYRKAHSYASYNRESLLRSSTCGCFSCLRIYRPIAITEWIDENANLSFADLRRADLSDSTLLLEELCKHANSSNSNPNSFFVNNSFAEDTTLQGE